MKRPRVEAIHPHTNALYYTILVVCVAVLVIFSYATWLVYALTAGTIFSIFVYVMAMPVIVAVLLLGLLVWSGKKRFFRAFKLESRRKT